MRLSLKFLSIITLIAVGCLFLWMTWMIVNSQYPIFVIGYVIAGMFCFYIAYLIYRRVRLHIFTKVLLGILTLAIIYALWILASAIIEDMQGKACTGLFGIPSECVSNAWFVVAFLATAYPWTQLGAGIFATIAWLIELNEERKRSTPTQ